MERKLYPQAIRMSEYVIAYLNDRPFVGEFYYRYAESLEELGQFENAINVYDTIFARLPREQDKGEATYRIGQIYLERLNNPEQAVIYFDSVLNHYPLGFAYNSARMSKPRAFLQLGNLKSARAEYTRLNAYRFNPDISEEIDFNLALLDFFELNFDSCAIALKKLMVDYPKGYFINDAVQISFLMDQAGEASELLEDFSEAILFEKRKLVDSTVSRLLSIADAENKALADIALFRLSEIALKQGDSTGATKFVDRLEAEFQDSYYLPYGLKTKADILTGNVETANSGKELYRRLLEMHPNYPFINEVREKLRKLESAPGPS
jgi:tetratricopeptide (TPR) repeat protein